MQTSEHGIRSGQVIYGIKPNGHLQWYRHDGGYYNGEPVWVAGDGGRKVGEGWNNFETVLHAHSHNTIYGIELRRRPEVVSPPRRLEPALPDWEAGDGGLLVAKGWNRYCLGIHRRRPKIHGLHRRR